jgi:hypothetical protein
MCFTRGAKDVKGVPVLSIPFICAKNPLFDIPKTVDSPEASFSSPRETRAPVLEERSTHAITPALQLRKVPVLARTSAAATATTSRIPRRPGTAVRNSDAPIIVMREHSQTDGRFSSSPVGNITKAKVKETRDAQTSPPPPADGSTRHSRTDDTEFNAVYVLFVTLFLIYVLFWWL